MTGRCPHCGSARYTPDQTPGGAGRNKCEACGAIAPVCDFYKIANASKYGTVNTKFMITSGNPNPIPMKPGERRFTGVEPLHTEKPAAPIRQYKDE